MPAGLDNNWIKFLTLWEKSVKFSVKECAKFVPDMVDAGMLLQAIGAPAKEVQEFEKISQFFQRAVAEQRQIMYG